MKITTYAFSAVLGLGLALAIPAHAQTMVGFDFSAGGNTPLPADTLAGVNPQENWNNLATANGSLSSGSVVDGNNLVVSGMSASWGANGADTLYYFGGNSFTNPPDANAVGDTDLFSDSLLTFGGEGTGYQGNFTVTGITFKKYTVIAYFEGGSGLLNFNGTPNESGTFDGGTNINIGSADNDGTGTFLEADPDLDSNEADYAEFTRQTASSFTLYDQQGAGGGLVGLQIIDNDPVVVPEPSTYALLCLGLSAVAWTYRKRATRS